MKEEDHPPIGPMLEVIVKLLVISSDDKNNSLNDSICKEEMMSAKKAMHNNKSGCDDWIVKFFICMYDTIDDDLLVMVGITIERKNSGCFQ